MNRRKLWAVAGGLVSLVAAATTVAATSASAAPTPDAPPAARPAGATVPAGFADWAAVYRYQEQLNNAAGRIAAADPGNASIVAAPGNHELRVHWKGPVPAAVRALAATLGVKVSFHPAAYGHGELVARARALAARPGVLEAAPAIDDGGLAVTVAGGQDPAALRAASAVPLAVTVGRRPEQTSSRQADSPPYFGGSLYVTPPGSGCTNGIPLVIGDARAMQSAGHCSDNGITVRIPGVAGPAGAGTVLGKQQCKDTLLISYPAGDVAQAVYTGDRSSSSSLPITRATFDFVGNLVSAGGAASGEHAVIPVQQTDVFATGSGICGAVGPLTKAAYPSATCAVARGDSGGPVYTPASDGSGVLVRGTVSLGQGAATCPGPDPNGFNAVLWAPAVRPSGSTVPGTLDFYRAEVPFVTRFPLTGTWTDGRTAGPRVTVWGDTIRVDMSAFHRPLATGSVLNPSVILVTFPDDRTHAGNLESPNRIRWDNGSVWTRL